MSLLREHIFDDMKIQVAQPMMQMGIERKGRISEKLDQLNNKKILFVEIFAH